MEALDGCLSIKDGGAIEGGRGQLSETLSEVDQMAEGGTFNLTT